MQKLSLLMSAVVADHFVQHQGLCEGPRGAQLGMWRKTNKAFCEKQCQATKGCRSFVFGEGTAHMYTGTCELYDMNNPIADGNGGWSCYDRQVAPETTISWQASQGLCDAPRGNILGMWRGKNYKFCQTQCEANPKCASFLVAGKDVPHVGGTCELYDGSNPTADGNTDWTCYNKKVVQAPIQYTRHQGICNSPRGVVLDM